MTTPNHTPGPWRIIDSRDQSNATTNQGVQTVTTYYTKDQAELILADWKLAQPLPRRGMHVTVQWVGGQRPNHCTIRLSDSKSTNGKRLYSFTFENLNQ